MPGPVKQLVGRAMPGERGFWLHEHALPIDQHAGRLTRLQTLVAATGLVPALGVSERLLVPGQSLQPFLDRPHEHVFIAQARKVQVARHVIGQLLDAHVVAAPQGDAVQFVAQADAAQLSHEQFLAPHLLRRPHRQRVVALELHLAPLQTATPASERGNRHRLDAQLPDNLDQVDKSVTNELNARLQQAPAEHAEALLSAYEVLQGLHDHGVLEPGAGPPQPGSGLDQGFEHEHPRHDREPGEVVGQVLLAEGQELGRPQGLTRLDAFDPVDQVEPHRSCHPGRLRPTLSRPHNRHIPYKEKEV